MILFWTVVIVCIILGWIVAGLRRPKSYWESRVDRLTLERDAQAATIEGQRQTIRELEKELAESKVSQSHAENKYNVVVVDRANLREQLDKWGLTIRQCSESTRSELVTKYNSL